MLFYLHIENLIIIDNITINFKDGFSCLTGETGAGKSLILDGLKYLTGQKIKDDVIRKGKDKALIEAGFNNLSANVISLLNEFEIEVSDELYISRLIKDNKKSVFRINGMVVPQQVIKRLTDELYDIHSQHDTMHLFNENNYFSFIDNEEICRIKLSYLDSFHNYKKTLKDYNALQELKTSNDKTLEFLFYDLDRLKKLDIKENEKEELTKELTLFIKNEKIFNAYSDIFSVFNESDLLQQVDKLQPLFDKVKTLNQSTNLNIETISSCYYDLEEQLNLVKKEINELALDDNIINYINERLKLIEDAEHHFNKKGNELILLKDEIEEKVSTINNIDLEIKNQESKLFKAYEECVSIAKKLSEMRKQQCCNLENSIITNLKQLELSKVRFKISCFESIVGDAFSNRLTFDGLNTVELLVSFNPGEELGLLKNVASGGELSRVMLAIKCSLYANKKLSLIVFDEIDTGVSGKAAKSIGLKMKEMANFTQVIAVTHLPIVASLAKTQYLVTKQFDNELTTIKTDALSFDERVQYIATMISPNDSLAAMDVARNLLLIGNKND